MAQQWLDDFTSYGTDAGRVARMLNGFYASADRTDLAVDPDPNAGGGFVLVKFGGGLGGDCRRVLTSNQLTVGLAARYWLPTLPGDNVGATSGYASFRDINNNEHLRVSCNPTGYLEVFRNDAGVAFPGTIIGITAVPVIVANAWRHVETKVFFDNAAGTVEIRVEGVQVLNLTGVRTQTNVGGVSAGCSSVAWMSAQSGLQSMYVKHAICWDGSGAVNNNFYGTCQVYKIVEDADVSLNWTPSSGATGFNLINETTPDDDVNYIFAPSPAPAPAKFSLTDLPADTTVVRGVALVHRSRKSDAGDGNIQAALLSAASVGLGASKPMSTAYTYYLDNFDLDPNGNINWTKASVDALNLQLNRTV